MSPRWGSCERRDFIAKVRKLGFNGPYRGRRHEFMVWQEYRLHIPSYDTYTVDKHREMVREVEGVLGRKITLEEWMRL